MGCYLLGIDIGTTGTKALLFSDTGQLLGHSYRSYRTHTPQVGFCEQDPEDWWRAVKETVRELCLHGDIAQNVAAISLSLQGGTVVPADAAGRPLRPAIVWNDQRCIQEHEEFLQEVGSAEDMYQKTGWKLGNGLPALAIRWIRNHEPELFFRVAKFMTVPDYISYRMTGIAVVDPSNFGINQLGDIRRGGYDEKLLQFAGITESLISPVVPTGTVIGPLTPQGAEELGLTTKTLLVSGAHDQYAVTTGAGITNPGDILISSGTSWVVTALSDHPSFDNGLSQSISGIPGIWGSLLALSSGGIYLEWMRNNVISGSGADYADINREATQRKAAEDMLFFYPSAGFCVPGAPFQKGTFLGLDISHDRYHMARAIMEGIAFQITWMMESLPTPPPVTGIKLAGGASRSPLWCQLLADISGYPIRISEVADLACVGAAIQAGIGCGIYANAEEGYRHMAIKEQVLYPQEKAVSQYAFLKNEYRRRAALLGGVYGILP